MYGFTTKIRRWTFTDKFEDGVCYVELKDGDTIQYMTVKYQKWICIESGTLSDTRRISTEFILVKT